MKYSQTIKRIITGAALALGFAGAYLYAPAWVISVAFVFILLFILFFEWPLFNAPKLTPLYPALPFLLLILLNQSDTRYLIPILFVAVFGGDTGAYIVGKLIGRHKLCPTISPLKTWEGFFGGIAGSIICTTLFCIFARYSINFYALIFVCCLLSIAGTGGDLFESYLKRRASLKDSGASLPGHGGWLDRFDSVLGAVMILYPLRYIIATLFKN